MKWNVKSFLKNFRKKTKSKDKKRIAIIVRKRNEKTKEKYDIQKNRKNRQSIKKIRKIRKENNIIWFWNREFHEIKNRISFFFFDEKTKKHEHRHKHRNTETINNNRHSINKIIFFDRWYRWVHRRIKQTRTTNFKTSQRNFHEIVETLKMFYLLKEIFTLTTEKTATATTETILIFFFTDSAKIFERDERNAEEFSIFIEILRETAERFRFLSLMMNRKKRNKKNWNN